MLKLFQKFLFLFIFLSILMPNFVVASGTYNVGGLGDVCYDGLVPCGKCVTVGGSIQQPPSEDAGKCSGEPNYFIPCTLCHAFIIIHDGVNFFIFSIILPIAALMIVVGGVLYITGGNNQNRIQWANSVFYNTFLGLIIIFGAFIFMGTFLSLIGVADWTGIGADEWFSINCNVSFSAEQLQKFEQIPCQ